MHAMHAWVHSTTMNRFGVLGDLVNIAGFLWDHTFYWMSEKNVAFGCSYYRIRIITRGGALSIEGGGWVGNFLFEFSLHKSKMTADRCVLKFLWRSVDVKHLDFSE